MIQISTSTNPKRVALPLYPFETNIIRMVPILTSSIRAKKINRGIKAAGINSKIRRDMTRVDLDKKIGCYFNNSILFKCGERGIRTLETPFGVYSLSRGALSTTQPSLRVRIVSHFVQSIKYMKLSEPFATSISNKFKLIPILFYLNINLPQI